MTWLRSFCYLARIILKSGSCDADTEERVSILCRDFIRRDLGFQYFPYSFLLQHLSCSFLKTLLMMILVLARLGYVNASDVIELKGRVACEISR